MNEYDLFDAIGGIDDDLLRRSEERKTVRKLPIRKALIAAAAVMLLAVTALATPAVREWFFGSKITEISDAEVIHYDNPDIVFGYRPGSGRVDLNLEGIGKTPDTILELRVPTYFESGGWDYDPDVLFPDLPFVEYVGTWQRWITEDGVKTGQWIIFRQKTITPASRDYPAGYDQFTIDLGNDAPVEQTTMTIGEQTYQVYQVGESELEGLVGFSAHTDVIWSDGEYAYHVHTGGMELDMIAEIIQSIAPAKNQDDYIRNAVYDSIGTYYTISVSGYELTAWQDREFSAWQRWGRPDDGISFEQHRDQAEGNDVYSINIPLTLSDLQYDNPTARIEEHDVDGVTVYLVWLDTETRAYWQADDCTFILSFYGNSDMTAEEAETYIRSMALMEAFPE